MASVLVTGSLGIHSINIGDHLYCYDTSVSRKQYLTYSESQWKLWCENGVQYINRIQREDWLRMFGQAGFALLEESSSFSDLTSLRVHPNIRGSAQRHRLYKLGLGRSEGLMQAHSP